MSKLARLALYALAPTVVLTVAPCPAGAAVGARRIEPTKWIVTYCQVGADYRAAASIAMQAVEGVLGDGVRTPAEAKAAKRHIVAALDEASDGAASARTLLARAGWPDVPNGAAMASLWVGAFADARDLFSTAGQTADSLPTTPAKLAAGVDTLSSTIQSGIDAISGHLARVEKLDRAGGLRAAVQRTPECATVMNHQ